MTKLAFVALVVAAAAWTFGNMGVARRAASAATIVFVVFLGISAILFLLAVFGVSCAR